MPNDTIRGEPARARTPDASDPIFLSPRVVDAAAFERFASALRALVGRATEHERTLDAGVGRSEAVLRRLAESAPGVESRLAAASGALSSLDDRLAEVRSVLDDDSARSSALDRATRTALTEFDRTLAERVASAEARLARMVEHASGRIEAAGRDAVEASLDAARRARDEMGRIRADAEAARDAGALHVQNLEDRIGRVEERVRAFSGPALRALVELCDRAEAALGGGGAGGPAKPGSLGEALARADEARDATDFCVRRLDSVRQEAERAQSTLGEALNNSAGLIAEFTQRQATLAKATLDALRAGDEARTALEARARELVASIRDEVATASAPAPVKPRQRRQ